MKKRLFAMTLIFCLGLCACNKKEEKEAIDTKPTVTNEGNDQVDTPKDTVQVEPKQKVELSDFLYSFQIAINDEVIQLPVKYKDLVSTGWEYTGDENQVIPVSDYIESSYFDKGDDSIYGLFYNFGTKEVVAKDCELYALSISLFTKTVSTKVILPKQIELGVSTKDEVVATYGEPTKTYDTDFPSYFYEISEDVYINLQFNDEGILQSIYMENSGDYDNSGVSDDSEDSDDTMTGEVEVEDYVAPNELSSDLYLYTFEFDGDLYQFPTPLSEFMSNGWELNTDIEPSVSGDYTDLVLSRDGKEYIFSMLNDEYNSSNLDGRITYLYINTDDYNIPITCGNGITIGMTKTELQEALSDYTVEIDDSDKSSICYHVTEEGYDYSGYWFYLSDDVVSDIEINY